MLGLFFWATHSQCWQSADGGDYHTVGIKAERTFWAWGYGLYGQLGHNTNFSAYTPTLVDCDLLGMPTIEVPKFVVYPNPVAEEFTIAGTELITSIHIYDVKGMLVKGTPANVTQGVDVSDLASGLYLLQIEALDGAISFVRFVKK